MFDLKALDDGELTKKLLESAFFLIFFVSVVAIAFVVLTVFGSWGRTGGGGGRVARPVTAEQMGKGKKKQAGHSSDSSPSVVKKEEGSRPARKDAGNRRSASSAVRAKAASRILEVETSKEASAAPSVGHTNSAPPSYSRGAPVAASEVADWCVKSRHHDRRVASFSPSPAVEEFEVSADEKARAKCSYLPPAAAVADGPSSTLADELTALLECEKKSLPGGLQASSGSTVSTSPLSAAPPPAVNVWEQRKAAHGRELEARLVREYNPLDGVLCAEGDLGSSSSSAPFTSVPGVTASVVDNS